MKGLGVYVLKFALTLGLAEPVVRMFDGVRMPWRGFAYGLVYIVIFVVLSLIIEIVKARKDPDVREATALGMNIIRFRKYRKLHDELMAIYKKHGTESPEARDKLLEILEYESRPGEWAWFSEYMYRKSRERFFNHEWDDEDTLGS